MIYMRSSILAAMVVPLIFLGCKKEVSPDYSALVPGTWVNTLVDDHAVLTDATFVMELRPDKVELYAIGFKLDANNKTWLESDKYTYSIIGNIIKIDGVGALGGNFHMEFKIRSADGTFLTFSVQKFTIDQVEYPDSKIYTCRKVKADLKSQIVGTWYGKSTTSGTTDTSFHYWQYFADGHFNYFYQDGAGNWISKPDNEGKYLLYGDFLASNYTNDLITGGSGKAFECWNITVTGNTMSWTGLRENGLSTSYRMDKVSGPPAIP